MKSTTKVRSFEAAGIYPRERKPHQTETKFIAKKSRQTGLPRLRIKILGQILGGIWPNLRRKLGEFSIF